MENPMDAFINWDGGENDQVPDIDFLFFDSVFPAPGSPPPPLSPTFSLINLQTDENPNVNEVPELVADSVDVQQPQVETATLQSLVNELLQRVKTVEDQLHCEQERVKALEGYVDQLEPYLLHLGSTIEEMAAED